MELQVADGSAVDHHEPGGPPTPDKPDISVVDYQHGDTTSIFLNLRVADIQACYEEWQAKGQSS